MEPAVPVPNPAAPVPGGRSLVPLAIVAGVVAALAVVGILLLQVLNRPATADGVAVDFVVAVHEADVERACLLLAPALRQTVLERAGATDCATLTQAVEESGQPAGEEAADVEVLEVQEDGDLATVRVTAPSGTPGVWTRVGLERVDEQWLVTEFDG